MSTKVEHPSALHCPTTDDTFLLRQHPVKVAPLDGYFEYNAFCPYLFGRVHFEPWLCFDDNVRSTARNVKDTLSKDPKALCEVQAELQTLWEKAHEQVLVSEFTTSRFFKAVFPLARSVLRAVDPEAPSLLCSDRGLLPRTAVRQPQILPLYNCVSIEAQQLHCLSISSFTPSYCAYEWCLDLESQKSCDARNLSDQWNALFAKSSEHANVHMRKQQRSMMQAVTHAMYVRSGCALLWNYRSLIAVRIVRETAVVDSAPDQVRVQVSNIYTNTDMETQNPNTMMALIAALRLSSAVALADSNNLSPMLGRIMERSRGFVDLAVDIDARGSIQEQAGLVGPPLTGSEGSSDLGFGATEYWFSDRAAALFEKQSGESRSSASFGLKFFECLLTNYTDVLYASTEISVLLLGTLGGVKVVTKYANVNSSDGMELIQNEVEIYDAIRRDKRELLGSCIPDVLAIRLKPKSDPLLVIEYVGHAVVRDEHGTVWVGKEAVSMRDWKQIVSAANRGLSVLARAGLRQMDLQISNVRAQRIRNSGTTACEAAGEWHVWWIDFGIGQWEDWSPSIEDKWHEEEYCRPPDSHYISGL